MKVFFLPELLFWHLKYFIDMQSKSIRLVLRYNVKEEIYSIIINPKSISAFFLLIVREAERERGK
jgi:hypothetical protein